MQSDASGTGAIGQMASNIINADNVTIERYTQAGSSNSGHRAWRLVTSPITNKTIHEAWQEGRTWISGGSNNVTETGTYGTLITGEGLTVAQAQDSGFDYVGAGNHTSIRSYQYNIANTGGTGSHLLQTMAPAPIYPSTTNRLICCLYAVTGWQTTQQQKAHLRCVLPGY